jgi:hypothetical protein
VKYTGADAQLCWESLTTDSGSPAKRHTMECGATRKLLGSNQDSPDPESVPQGK